METDRENAHRAAVRRDSRLAAGPGERPRIFGNCACRRRAGSVRIDPVVRGGAEVVSPNQRTPGNRGLAVAVPGRSDCGGDLCLGRPLMASELVGRASEIAVVESLLAGIADGGGSLLVLGDPGIGKSALVAAAFGALPMVGCGSWLVRGCRARRSFRSLGCTSCCGPETWATSVLAGVLLPQPLDGVTEGDTPAGGPCTTTGKVMVTAAWWPVRLRVSWPAEPAGQAAGCRGG
jgi:hypothetical protein